MCVRERERERERSSCVSESKLTLYVLSILLSSESNGSSGGSSHEEHATKNELGTVTEDGEYNTCTD